MKHGLQTIILFLLSVNFISAQITLTGKLNSAAKKTKIQLTNFEGINIPIEVNAKNEFIFKNDTLKDGFYDLDEIGKIYLTNGYTLKVTPTKANDYIFEGNGATENNALRIAKKALEKYLPLDKNSVYAGLADSGFKLEPNIFLQKIDSFKNYGVSLFAKSKDTFFKRYAALDLNFYCKPLLFYYFSFYGMDFKILNQMNDLYKDPKAKPADIANKLMALLSKAHKKTMDSKDREKLNELLTYWDKTDETLFKNSNYYREAFNNYFIFAGSGAKYYAMSHSNPEDKDIKNLAVANDAITNPYILNYFNYIYITNIINATKDTAIANKYYQQFISKNTRQDYLQTINEIYHNKLIYNNGMTAPMFSYTDISDKTIALENLKGKYVYIDVWATWCGPCKAEIPYLQKLEAEYKNKNIQFVSISVDEQKDKNKWKDYIIKNKLGGFQVITDSAFESLFIKKMNIYAIPRFILIDPNGKIVANNADKPSSNEIKILLNKLLL